MRTRLLTISALLVLGGLDLCAQLNPPATLNPSSIPLSGDVIGTAGASVVSKVGGIRQSNTKVLPSISNLVAYYDFTAYAPGTYSSISNLVTPGTHDLGGSIALNGYGVFNGSTSLSVAGGGFSLGTARTIITVLAPNTFGGTQVISGGSPSNNYDAILNGGYKFSTTFSGTQNTVQGTTATGFASSPVVLVTVTGVNRQDIWTNFAPTIGSVTGTPDALTVATVGSLNGSFDLNANVYGIAFYNTALTTAQIQQAISFMMARFNQGDFKGLYGFVGDSLTVGVNSTGNGNYPAQVLLTVNNWNWINVAISGTTAQQWQGTSWTGTGMSLDSYLTPYYQNNIAFVWMGTNDIANSGTSAAQTYQYLANYCAQRKANGWRVIVLTMLPRGSSSTVETSRQSFNSMIRAGYTAFADALADVGNNATIGQAGDQNNLTYFSSDQTHLTNAGYLIVAQMVEAQLAALGLN